MKEKIPSIEEVWVNPGDESKMFGISSEVNNTYEALSKWGKGPDIFAAIRQFRCGLAHIMKIAKDRREAVDEALKSFNSKLKPLAKENDLLRKSSYAYRRLYMALKKALRDHLTSNPDEFLIYDRIMATARKYMTESVNYEEEAIQKAVERIKRLNEAQTETAAKPQKGKK